MTPRPPRLGDVLVAWVAICVLVLCAAPAHASSGRIRSVQQTGDKLRFTFTAIGAQRPASGDTLKVSLDGRVVAASAQPIDASSKVERRIMLVIDTSGSMAHGGIDGAKQAALSLLSRIPADVEVGVVSFGDAPHVLVMPTTDRARTRGAVSSLVAAGETTLYDGVIAAAHALGRSGDRRLLLLSDGGDTRSRTKLPQLLAALSSSGATLDAVAFKTDESASATLQQIARAGHGTVVAAAGVADISRAFTATAQELSAQFVVTAAVPADLAGRQVTLRADAGNGIADETVILLAAAAKPAATPTTSAVTSAAGSSSWWGTKAALQAGLVALFLAVMLAVLAFASWGLPAISDRRRNRHLDVYTLIKRPAAKPKQKSVFGDTGIAQSALELAGRVIDKRNMREKLTAALERAGVALTPNEFLVTQAAVALLSWLLLTLLFGGGIFVLLLAAVLGYKGPKMWLSFKGSRRHAKFLAALPDALQLAAGSLQSGYSLLQALDAIVREGRPPVSHEIGRALSEARLGIPVEDALDNVAARLGDRDFGWTVMAIRIQREVGGNLSEVLTTVAGTLRERAALRRQVKALSAEGRLSAYILGGLPIFIALYMFAFRRSYIRPLYTEGLGIAMLTGGVVLVTAGALWMRKLVRVEI